MTTTEPTAAAPRPGAALLDVNALLALTLDSHVHHAAAIVRFADVAANWATTPITELALARLLLTEPVVGRVVEPAEVLGVIARLRALDGWAFLTDDVGLDSDAIDVRVLAGRGQVTDLHLVAVAARHRAILCTFDARLPRILAPDDRRHVHVWSG